MVMPFRNVDGPSEMLESKEAHLDSRILFANSRKRQRGIQFRNCPELPINSPGGLHLFIRNRL